MASAQTGSQLSCQHKQLCWVAQSRTRVHRNNPATSGILVQNSCSLLLDLDPSTVPSAQPAAEDCLITSRLNKGDAVTLQYIPLYSSRVLVPLVCFSAMSLYRVSCAIVSLSVSV